jgi:hypothetical protein
MQKSRIHWIGLRPFIGCLDVRPQEVLVHVQLGTGKSTMAIRLHGSARITSSVRAKVQLAAGAHRSLAKLYGFNPKTVAQRRARTSVRVESANCQKRLAE